MKKLRSQRAITLFAALGWSTSTLFACSSAGGGSGGGASDGGGPHESGDGDSNTMGGAGGTNQESPSSGGSPTQMGSGGEMSEGGMGGFIPDEPAPDCNDGVKNGDETGTDCGANCSPCELDESCLEDSDCSSGLCLSAACVLPSCGDGVVSDGEDCDEGGEETASCNKDCTLAACGDGIVNATAGEVCERTSDAQPWERCNASCSYGVALDGTFAPRRSSESDPNPWQVLSSNTLDTPSLSGLQSFHYSASPYIYDLSAVHRFDIAADEWEEIDASEPDGLDGISWVNGAVDSSGIWVPRVGAMYRFDFLEQDWLLEAETAPDGSAPETAAVFDGEGQIWFYSADDVVVRFDPKTQMHQTYDLSAASLGFDVDGPRLAYDPLSNQILIGAHFEAEIALLDLSTFQFSLSSESPGGALNGVFCQDRAGGVYVGSAGQPYGMYRYDVASDSFALLPDLAIPTDGTSSCVVSEDGYLYVSSDTPPPTGRGGITHFFMRLPLGRR